MTKRTVLIKQIKSSILKKNDFFNNKKHLVYTLGLIIFLCLLCSLCSNKKYECNIDVRCEVINEGGGISAYSIKDGKPVSGIVKYRLNDGSQGEENLKNGKSHGKARIYWPNGKLRIETYFTDGIIKDAVEKIYYDNGKLESVKKYIDGKPFEKKDYWENGNLKHDLHYEISKLRPGEMVLVGENKSYHENGMLREVSYFEDEKQIKHEIYNEDGSQKSDEDIEKEKLVMEFANLYEYGNELAGVRIGLCLIEKQGESFLRGEIDMLKNIPNYSSKLRKLAMVMGCF